MRTVPRALALVLAGALAACARHAPPVLAEAPPPPPPAAAAMPALASPGMTIPVANADGTYPTPNDGVGGAAAVWHLRAALNVAALSCPGEQGQRITAAYNAFLRGQRAKLTQVHQALGGDASDVGMTRLYNYYAQLPARAGYCAAADTVAQQVPATPPEQLEAFAVQQLTVLDQPFRDFYRAYDDWRAGRPAIALASIAQPASQPPRIEVDPAVYR